MTTYTVASGYDTFVTSLTPSTPQSGNSSVFPGLVAGGWGLVYLPIPSDVAHATIASATLTAVPAVATTAQTLTVALVTSSWAAGTATWNQKPTAGATQATSMPAVSAGVPVNFDVTTLIQAVASGQAWYGFRLTIASTITQFYSFDSGQPSWTLTINTTEAPEQPQSLVPNGTVVGSGAPVVTCDFMDAGGLTDDMAAMNVQISTTSSFASPVYDQTGTTTVPVFDLASPPPGASAFTAVTSGTTRFWRVRVQDTDGLWSDWSDPASFTYRTRGTLTLLTPAAGVLWDPTSDIVATSSVNMTAYRVQVTSAADRTAIKFDSGRLPANPAALTTIDVALPQEYRGQRVLTDDQDYQLHIQAWDTFTNRQATPGLPTYVESWTTFHFDDDLTKTPVTTLDASQEGPGPAVTLTWTRPSAADAWVVLRDDAVIARLDPVDVISGVSTWSWDDQHPTPWIEHDYVVKALTNGTPNKVSGPSPVASIIPDTTAVWIYTSDGQSVALDMTDTSQLVVKDRRNSYKPINLRYDVDVVTGMEGISGPMTGIVPSGLTADSQTAEDARDLLLAIKANPSVPVRLIFGMFSGRVLLRDISVTPSPLGNGAVPILQVSFGVNQVGDFESVL